MGSPNDVKRNGQRAVRQAARQALRPLGLQQRGSSGRNWYDDRGWWRINVWFSSSGFSSTVTLSVGIQYYWQLVPHEYVRSALGPGPVQPYPTGALDSSIGPPESVADAYAHEAARQVDEIRIDHDSDRAHLELRARQASPETLSDGSPNLAAETGLVDAVLANAVLDRCDRARKLLDRQRHVLTANPAQDRDGALTEQLVMLSTVIDAPQPRAAVSTLVNRGRELLALPSIHDPFSDLDP